MATRRFKINPGEQLGDVVEEVGAAVNSDAVELTVDLATTYVNLDGANTRGLTKAEVIEAIDKIKAHISTINWPPA